MIIQEKRRKCLSYFWPAVFITVCLVAAIAYLLYWKKQQISQSHVELIAPIVFSVEASSMPATPDFIAELVRVDDPNLQKIVSDGLSGSKGTYSFVIENLKTGAYYGFNSDHEYQSASLYKLWVMGAIYQAEDNGDLSDDKVLSEDVPTLNRKFQIDPEDAEQTNGTISYSVSEALNRMITFSDNYSALLLTEKVGLKKVAQFLSQNGFKHSAVGINGDAPSTTASDIALYFKKLYKAELADKEYTEKMLGLLKQQQIKTKLPKGLPDSLVMAHKTGEIYTFSHDAGIVYTPMGDYIIVAMSDSDTPAVAEDRISAISKAVYGYFTR